MCGTRWKTDDEIFSETAKNRSTGTRGHCLWPDRICFGKVRVRWSLENAAQSGAVHAVWGNIQFGAWHRWNNLFAAVWTASRCSKDEFIWLRCRKRYYTACNNSTRHTSHSTVRFCRRWGYANSADSGFIYAAFEKTGWKGCWTSKWKRWIFSKSEGGANEVWCCNYHCRCRWWNFCNAS